MTASSYTHAILSQPALETDSNEAELAHQDPDWALYVASSWSRSHAESNVLRHRADEVLRKGEQLASENHRLAAENEHLWKQVQDYQQEQHLMGKRLHDTTMRAQELDRKERLTAESEATLRVQESLLEETLRKERETTESMRMVLERERHHSAELAARSFADAEALSACHRNQIADVHARLNEAVRANQQWERKLIEVQGRIDAATLEREILAATSEERTQTEAAETKIQELRELLHAAEVECRKLKADLRPLKQFHDQFVGDERVGPHSCSDLSRTKQQIEFLKISYEHAMSQLKEKEITCTGLEEHVSSREITIERLQVEHQALERQLKLSEERAAAYEKRFYDVERACSQQTKLSVASTRTPSPMAVSASSPGDDSGNRAESVHLCTSKEISQQTEVHSLSSVNAILRRQLDAVRKENVQLRIDRCSMLPCAEKACTSEKLDAKEEAWRERITNLKGAVSPHLGDPRTLTEPTEGAATLHAQRNQTSSTNNACRSAYGAHNDRSPERTSPDMDKRVAERSATRERRRYSGTDGPEVAIVAMHDRGINNDRFAFDYKPPPPRMPPPVLGRPQSAQANNACRFKRPM